jgi:hypothetical protein
MTIRRLLSSLALLILSATAGGCGTKGDAVAGLVPRTWTMTASSGHIASSCFGSWEECGSLKRTYATHSDAHGAIDALATRLRGAGWTVETVNGAKISAFNSKDLRSQTARLYAEVTDSTASLTYVHW